jgi:hypothetical protein
MGCTWFGGRAIIVAGVSIKNGAISGTASIEIFRSETVLVKPTVRCLISPGSKNAVIVAGDHVIFICVEEVEVA